MYLPHSITHIIILCFSFFLLIGAWFGFKAGSKISLIMGIVSGVLIFLGDLIFSYNEKPGLMFLMIVSGLLVVSFVQRLLKTKKMMPSGMLLIVSGLFFSFILIQFLH